MVEPGYEEALLLPTAAHPARNELINMKTEENFTVQTMKLFRIFKLIS